MDRRQFLSNAGKLGLLTMGSSVLPMCISPAIAAGPGQDLGFNLMTGSRTLHMYRPESKEVLHIEYLRDGVWIGDAYSHICWFLRDVKARQHIAMDTDLIAILDWTQQYLRRFGYTDPLTILSAFRSAATNEATEGAAQKSQHLNGKAVDLHIPGLSAEYLGRLFLWLSQGGVGVYESRKFVHVDTANVRTWRG